MIIFIRSRKSVYIITLFNLVFNKYRIVFISIATYVRLGKNVIFDIKMNVKSSHDERLR